MKAALFLLLLPALALAQGRLPGSGSSASSGGPACALASTTSAFAASFRATTADTAVTAFGCDAVLTSCVKYGPGTKTSCGTNAAGEVICGLVSDATGVWRFYGTSHFNTANAQNFVASNGVTAGAVLDFGNNSFMRNTSSGKMPLVDDPEGFRVTCKATLTTCASANEGTILPICGAGGSFTRHCLCTGDGTVYGWRNLLNPSAGAGTSTTCPAT